MTLVDPPRPLRSPGRLSRKARGDWRIDPPLALTLDFVPIWTVILAVSVFMYVLLDGFDLGVGILFPLAPTTPRATR